MPRLYYEEKDRQRIEDIIHKARFGNSTEYTLANTQANRITKLDKAIRRASASIAVLGADHRVSRIFIARSRFLGYIGDFAGQAPNRGQNPHSNRTVETQPKPEKKTDKIKVVLSEGIQLGDSILDQIERFK
jgi:hypothetical protein